MKKIMLITTVIAIITGCAAKPRTAPELLAEMNLITETYGKDSAEINKRVMDFWASLSEEEMKTLEEHQEKENQAQIKAIDELIKQHDKKKL
jgi:hypothetical protein